jgi:hypothetical protein
LYVATNVAIKPNWQILIKLENANGNNDYEIENFEETFYLHNSKEFKEIIKENFAKSLVQNILNPKQIIDDNSKTITIALGEGFRPLGTIP